MAVTADHCKITVSNVWAHLSGGDAYADDLLVEKMSYFAAGYRFTWAFQNGEWNGKTVVFNRSDRSFRSGLVPMVKDWLEGKDYVVEVVDLRRRPAGPIRPWDLKGATVRKHQQEAIASVIEVGQGTVHHATGSGKTETMAGLIQMIDQPALILVDQKQLAQQTAERIADRLGLGKLEVGIMGGGKKRPKRITVATFATLNAMRGKKPKGRMAPRVREQMERERQRKTEKLQEWLRGFTSLYIDEAHHLVAETYSEIADLCDAAYYRFAFSATPFKSEKGKLGADAAAILHVTGATGPILHTFDQKQMIAAGYAVKPHITMYRWHEDDPKKGWDKDDFEIDDAAYGYTGRWSGVGSRRVKDDGLYDVAVVDHVGRNEAVVDATKLLYQNGHTTILLVDRIAHGEMLRDWLEEDLGIEIPFISGRTPDKQRAEVRATLDTGSTRLVVSNVLNEGVDIPAISGMVFAGAQKSGHLYVQRVGRGMRLKAGKSRLDIVDFYDTHSSLMLWHSKQRMQAYEHAGYEVEVV